MTPEARQQHDGAQLLRLRRLREDAARQRRDERARERDAAVAAVQAREAEIARLRADIASLAGYVVGDGATGLPRTTPYAAARRAVLDDLLERAEYGLIDDQDALDEAEQALARAQAACLQAARQREAVEALQASSRRTLLRAREQRIERETAPTGHAWALLATTRTRP